LEIFKNGRISKLNLEGIWVTKTGEKTEILFKNGFYYTRHLEGNEEKFHRHNRKNLEKYLKHYNMEKLQNE
jgi:hypothetical protein